MLNMHCTIAQRVAARHRARTRIGAVAEPEALLRELQKLFNTYADYVAEAKELQIQYGVWKKEIAQGTSTRFVLPKNLQDVSWGIQYNLLKRYNRDFGRTWTLALAILQQYNLPTALRKKVEVVAKYWATKQQPRMPKLPHSRPGGFEREDASLVYYLQNVETVREQQAVLTEALAKGRLIATGDATDPVKVKAGPFTLINMGGFDADVMSQAAETFKKAADYASTSGFGSVCYGDVHVTKQVSRKNTLAFYMIAQDEVFVQSDITPTTRNIRTLLHELGHRYENKFLRPKSTAHSMYYTIGSKHRDEIRKLKPEKGEVLVDKKGVSYVVDGIIGDKVQLHPQKSETVDPFRRMQEKAVINIEGYYALKGLDPRKDVDFKGFITPYAAKDPSENFAEMFSFYCLGDLPPTQAALFEVKVFDAPTELDKPYGWET